LQGLCKILLFNIKPAIFYHAINTTIHLNQDTKDTKHNSISQKVVKHLEQIY